MTRMIDHDDEAVVAVEALRGVVSLPIAESLDEIPHHSCIPEIERWVFRGIPHLVSVHHVTQADPQDRGYCELHEHVDEDEVNLLLGTTDDFRFRITLGDVEHILGPVAAVLVPAGTTHSANVISGSGYYVVLKSAAAE